MEIFLNILFLIVGFILLIKGADFFVSGASSVAKKMRISSLIIGLTIVAIGTSLPEFTVSVIGAIKGVPEMSLGNIVGSNMFNTFMCLGVVALISPLYLKKSTRQIDLPYMLLVTFLLLFFSLDIYINGEADNIISRTEGILFLGSLVVYMWITIANVKRKPMTPTPERLSINEAPAEENSKAAETTAENLKSENSETTQTEPKKEKNEEMKLWKTILFLILGFIGIIFGGECVSSTSQFLALKIGMSESLVGLTIVAIGTSLPELVTSIVAVKKGEKELALGNVIGSNIINISLILGMVASINPIYISLYTLIDFAILFVTSLIFLFMCLHKGRLKMVHGLIFVGIYFAYMAFEIIRNYFF